MASAPASLPVDRLRWRCDPAQLGFQTTAEVQPLDVLFGQDRGLEAIDLALGLQAEGYNLYVAGPSGTGRETAVRDQIARTAASRPAPPDRCYLHNFQDATRPLAGELPAGQGPDLARDLDDFAVACRREIPGLFEREQYQQRRAAILQTLQSQRERLFSALQDLAGDAGFALQETPVGIATIPLLGPGQPMSPEAFALLPDERQAALRAQGQGLQGAVGDYLLAVRRLEREAQEQIRALDREVVNFAIGHRLDALRSSYGGQAAIVGHLDAIQADLLDNLDDLRQPEGTPAPVPLVQRASPYERYRANVVVTNRPDAGAPVVYEPNPTYYNLIGRIDYRASLAAMATDYTLIKPGALHRANGGYLLLQARDVLRNAFAWDVLERALRDGEIRIENLGDQLSAIPTATLRPEPIPLQVKVVLIGDLPTHQILHQLDPDFRRLFRVKAQFGALLDRTPDAIRAYAAFVSHEARRVGLRPFDREAVALLVEHGARLAGHQGRLSAEFNRLSDVLVEADFHARRDGAEVVGAAHIDRAIAARERRANLIEDETQRLIDDGTIAIDTRTETIGQVHGLAVADLGDHLFARPARITARVGVGGDGLVNIEREVELSGPTHSKGVLILGGYLLGQYAHDLPLALSARLTFEQTYGAVDGDSASSAELYALISALADLPLRQGIAVTGSVNQRGEVQAIGEATRKVEGFFVVCKAQGLTGDQGVIIPASNVQHLQLRAEVLDAIAAGQFHVWAVRHVDEGLAILSGLPAGERRRDGTYLSDTIHGRAQRRLRELATRLADFGGGRRQRLRPQALTAPGANSHARAGEG